MDPSDTRRAVGKDVSYERVGPRVSLRRPSQSIVALGAR